MSDSDGSGSLVPFQYGEATVRTVVIDGEPWFVLADLCRALGISQPHRVAERIDDDMKGRHLVTTPGGAQEMTVVNEPGMYEVVIRSDKPGAAKFRRWITSAVLPEIRKTGSFNAPTMHPELVSRADLARMVLAAEEEKSVMAAALESAAPAIAYHELHIAENDDVVTVKTWGTQYGMTEPRAYALLRDKNIVYRTVIGSRWSKSKGRVVEVYEYRPRAGRVTFDWFDLRPQHDAPRHHNGQVRQTLYVKQFFGDQLATRCGLVRQIPGGAA